MSKKSLDDNWVETLCVWADKNNISSKDFPRNRSELLTLTELYMDDEYYFKKIPKELGNLTRLTALSFNIYDYTAESIPEELAKLINLTELHLTVYSNDNSEIILSKDIFNVKQLEQLTRLSLDGDLSYSSIDLILKNCKDLSYLGINNNCFLKYLSPSICNLFSIGELVLINNENLLLTKKQFAWAESLRDDEKGFDKTYTTLLPDGTTYSYTTDYGQKFRYYCIIPFLNT